MNVHNNVPQPAHMTIDVMAEAIATAMRALDRIAQGESPTDVIEETGCTAALTEARQQYQASPYAAARSLTLWPADDARVNDALRTAERNFEDALDRLRALGFEPAREGYARMGASHVGLSLPTQRALLNAVEVGLFGVTKDVETSGAVDISGLKGTFEQAQAMVAADGPRPIRVVVDVADGEVFAVSAECELEAVVLDHDRASQHSEPVEIDGGTANASRIVDGGANPKLCDLVFAGLQDVDANELGMKP